VVNDWTCYTVLVLLSTGRGRDVDGSGTVLPSTQIFRHLGTDSTELSWYPVLAQVEERMQESDLPVRIVQAICTIRE
jgi:hypothetical protein